MNDDGLSHRVRDLNHIHSSHFASGFIRWGSIKDRCVGARSRRFGENFGSTDAFLNKKRILIYARAGSKRGSAACQLTVMFDSPGSSCLHSLKASMDQSSKLTGSDKQQRLALRLQLAFY